MPVIRYRTRDLTRLLPGTARTMRRIERITGRSDDMLILRGVNVFPTQIEEQLLRVEGLAPHYEIVLTRPGRLDEMTVRVEARVNLSEGALASVSERLAALIKENVGVSVSCEVGAPGTLKRSEGKAQRVVDHRNSDR
jgi:phenylacetate-CoA ligase